MPAERTAHLIGMLPGIPVSAGFAVKAASRLDGKLQDAVFDDAMQATLARWCRIRSYLASAAAHGLSALEAVTAALTGKPWLPLPAV